METIITKRLHLQFDENGIAVTDFDFKVLQQQYAQYKLNRSTEIITITEGYIYVTYRALDISTNSMSGGDIADYYH
jgi:flagellar basal body rod protein FlgG